MVNCILTLAPAFQHWSVLGKVLAVSPDPPRPTLPLRRRIGGKGLGPRLGDQRRQDALAKSRDKIAFLA